MSDLYIRRLAVIRDDLDIARQTFKFIIENWHQQNVQTFFARTSLENIRDVESDLDTTWFLRLTAEFECVLRDHHKNESSHRPLSTAQSGLESRLVSESCVEQGKNNA